MVRVCHLPTFVSVEPSSICQLHCPECPVGMRNNHPSVGHYMSLELFEKILSEVSATAHTMQFYFQGEPLLNSALPAMISKAHQLGIYTIVSTNAQSLTEEMANSLISSGLSRIIVSVDGFSDTSYTAYRVGGSLHRALAGLRFLKSAKVAYKSSIRIELQVLRLRSNEHEWQWIRRNYKSLGATHLVFKTAQFYDYEAGNPLMPTDERYSRYKKTADGSYRLRHPHFSSIGFRCSPCYRLWSGCVITTRGDVLACCYDKEHQHSLGNIADDSLCAIFHSEEANVLRHRVLLQPNMLPAMCENCDH